MFYRRALIALCLIVVDWESYLPEGERVNFAPPPSIHKESVAICSSILLILGFSPPKTTRKGSRGTGVLKAVKMQMEVAREEYEQLEGGYDNPGHEVSITETLNGNQ